MSALIINEDEGTVGTNRTDLIRARSCRHKQFDSPTKYLLLILKRGKWYKQQYTSRTWSPSHDCRLAFYMSIMWVVCKKNVQPVTAEEVTDRSLEIGTPSAIVSPLHRTTAFHFSILPVAYWSRYAMNRKTTCGTIATYECGKEKKWNTIGKQRIITVSIEAVLSAQPRVMRTDWRIRPWLQIIKDGGK